MHLVRLDGVDLPFPANSLTAINASSVLHEIYSYGDGIRAVHQCLAGIGRTLKHGCLFTFRDVYLPKTCSFDDRVTIHLTYPLFRKFFDFYQQVNTLLKDTLRAQSKRANSTLSLPAFVAADVLNHFLFFRKDCRRILEAQSVGENEVDDSLIGQYIQENPQLAQKLISLDAGEQYIYAPASELVAYLTEAGLSLEQQDFRTHQNHFEYQNQIGLTPLGGTKLRMVFRKK